MSPSPKYQPHNRHHNRGIRPARGQDDSGAVLSIATLHLLRRGVDLSLLLLLLLVPPQQNDDDDKDYDGDDDGDDDTSDGAGLELLLRLGFAVLATSALARNELNEVHRGAGLVSTTTFDDE